MKLIEDFGLVSRATNCGGPNESFRLQHYEITRDDVSVLKPHYLGFCHRAHKFVAGDVGRQIEVVSQGDHYTAWSFI